MTSPGLSPGPRPKRKIRKTTATACPRRATIGHDGLVRPFADREGLRLLEGNPLLKEYALNFLRSGLNFLPFLWISPAREWCRVELQRCVGASGQAKALISVTSGEAPYRLTARELDVLTLIANGYINQGIAAALDTSLRTVTTHVERILNKIGVGSRSTLAALAVEQGLLRVPFPGGGATRSALSVGMLENPSADIQTGNRKMLRLDRRPIVIGTPLSLGGFSSADAVEMLNGTRLAIDEINRRGGIGGRRLELRVADCDVSDRWSVRDAVKQLIDSEVDAVTSGYTCAEDLVQDMMADYGAPYLHCVTMEAMVERVRREPSRLRNIFQTGPTDIHYGPECLRLFSDLRDSGQWQPRNRHICVIQSQWSQMDIGLGRMYEIAERRGWQIHEINGLPIKGIEWDKVLEQVHAIAPAAILLANYFPEESIAFQRAFTANRTNALIYTLYGPSVPLYREELGEACEGVLWATSTGTYSDPFARRFARSYIDMHKVRPGRAHAGLAYDRINLLGTAWARAENPRRFDAVISRLRTLVHRGVSGTYTLDNSGQCGSCYADAEGDPTRAQAHLVFQIQNGRNTILAPNLFADSSFRLPGWFES